MNNPLPPRYTPPHRRTPTPTSPALFDNNIPDSAGIVIYNNINNTILIGTGSDYGYDQNARKIKYDQSLDNFINKIDELGIFGIESNVMKNFKLRYDNKHGQNKSELIIKYKLIQINDPFKFIIEYILNENFVNPIYEKYHIVDDGYSCKICISNNLDGIPKGRSNIEETFNKTAIREFKEETGFDLYELNNNLIPLPIPSVDKVKNNILYDIGIYGRYQIYFISVDTEIANKILVSYSNHRYNSELFKLRFINEKIDNLNLVSKNVISYLSKNNYISEKFKDNENVIIRPRFTKDNTNFLKELQKYETKLDALRNSTNN